MREAFEYAVVWTLVRLLGAAPRSLARGIGSGVGSVAYQVLPRLRRMGLRNLELAFPQLSDADRDEILRRLYRNLGWLLAEFCQMPRYTPENTADFFATRGWSTIWPRASGEGRADRNRPPGRMGAVELLPFADGLSDEYGDPAARNPRVERWSTAFAASRQSRTAQRRLCPRTAGRDAAGETVGILMDTNMTPPQGVFVPFFGSGLHRVGSGARGAEDGSGGAAGLHAVGRGGAKICPALWR